MKDRLTTAPLPKERPQGSCGTWNARSAFGKASWSLEQPAGLFCIVCWQEILSPVERGFFSGSPKSFARMGRGGAMERYISIIEIF